MRKPDCRTCGACCLGGYDVPGGWADCTVDDVKRMSRAVRARLVEGGWAGALPATPTVMTRQFGAVCAFLRGTPGKRCSCRIYVTRPEVCRTFLPGSRSCREARDEIGLVDAERTGFPRRWDGERTDA